MKVDNRILRKLITEGDVKSVMAAFQVQRRALSATESLLQARADQLAIVRRAYAELQDERDRLARGIDSVAGFFESQGLGAKWERLRRKYRLDQSR